VRQRQLLTGYRYGFGFAISYGFGSVFNNVVESTVQTRLGGNCVFLTALCEACRARPCRPTNSIEARGDMLGSGGTFVIRLARTFFAKAGPRLPSPPRILRLSYASGATDTAAPPTLEGPAIGGVHSRSVLRRIHQL